MFPPAGALADVRVAKRPFARQLLLCLLLVVSGCAVAPQVPPAVPDDDAEEPEPQSEPQPEPPPSPVPAPDAEPVAPPEPVPQPEALRVAVVLSERSEAYERVAEELVPLLDGPLVYNLSDKSLSATEAFLAIADSAVEVVIAIGLRAAQSAAELSSVPVVYCQVFNFTAPEASGIPVKGVSAIPPLSMQMRAWKELNPKLRKIGTIVGPGHQALLEEAQEAAFAHGVDVEYRLADSDRETLYLFKRMAPAIDGFWLFPDNRVLSLAVLEDILRSAPRYDVEVAVFNRGLLEMGAALSSLSVYSDVAATVLAVTERLAAGASDGVPELTPLSQIEIRTGDARSQGGAGGLDPQSARGAR